MDEALLQALAAQANAVPMPAGRAAAHLSAVKANNDRLAAAALGRLGVEHPPCTLENFRAGFAAGDAVRP